MRAGVAVAFAVSACGRIGFGERTDSDARSGDALGMSCADDFADGVPCTPWGATMTMATSITEADGALIITPLPNTSGALGSCLRAGVPVPDAGLVVEVGAVLPDGATGFTVDDGVIGGTMFVDTGGRVSVSVDSTTFRTAPYEPTAMRWWRFRRAEPAMIFDTSPDGSAWTLFTEGSIAIASTVSVQLYAYQQSLVADPGSARFEAVNVCP